ncbi:MAG: competence/damage-inducible protein A [Elusimicrobia bacterium RIFOXYC2_FULL_34_12]|nr:MAG: competence/damage-inducible protein A [Elusimicrobia bacterium RIFOXYC2_FULL_34_12]OGS38205.1 MAG: competence/damage-inducible protein A [Elusimicrobia bacterium RIFOXYD2_FULL_34_30]
MHIEIVCIGSELLLGFVNTNGAYISEKIATIGLKVDREISVGDEFNELKNVLEESLKRSNVVITTGGLGPTFDDFTREVVSKITNKKLVLDKEQLKVLNDFFVKRNYKMSKSNEKQAFILDGAEVIQNSIGTAPGQILEVEDKYLILLPGPPRELKPMLENTVMPFLKERFEKGILKVKILHTTGMPESTVDEKIRKIIDTEMELEGGEISFSILAKHTGVDVKMLVSGKDEMLIDEAIQKLKKEFYDVLGDIIYSEDNQTLESVVGELLLKKRKTLSVAESCTGGLIAHRITNVAGSSLYFKQGIVSYSEMSKKKILNVKEDTLNKFGAVSEQVAIEMAEGVKNGMETDYGISTTGIAGPKASSTGKPVGLAYIALVSNNKKIVKQFNFTGLRTEIKDKIATAALDILRRNII